MQRGLVAVAFSVDRNERVGDLRAVRGDLRISDPSELVNVSRGDQALIGGGEGERTKKEESDATGHWGIVAATTADPQDSEPAPTRGSGRVGGAFARHAGHLLGEDDRLGKFLHRPAHAAAFVPQRQIRLLFRQVVTRL